MMIPPTGEQLKRKLLKVLGAEQQENDSDLDEFNSILLQLSLALMMIFMIAFFLFMSKVDVDLSQIDSLKKQLSESEKARILHAVDQVTEKYRIRYGLKEFMYVDPVSGTKSFEFAGVIENGVLSHPGPMQNSFLSGAASAKKDYDNTDVLKKDWIRAVNDLAGQIALNESSLVQNLVEDGILRVRREVIEVQTLAAAAVQEYFVRNPDQVKNERIKNLLAKINREPDSPERSKWMKELTSLLNQYAYDHLARQSGVNMLEVHR